MRDMTCNAKCTVYSRVCGYYSPVESWNRGKREEFKDRKTYVVEKTFNDMAGRDRRGQSDTAGV